MCEKYFAILDFADLGSSNVRAIQTARKQLFDAVSAAGSVELEVDLNAAVVGATFVGVLIDAASRASRLGGRLVLQNVSQSTIAVLRICGCESLLAPPLLLRQKRKLGLKRTRTTDFQSVATAVNSSRTRR